MCVIDLNFALTCLISLFFPFALLSLSHTLYVAPLNPKFQRCWNWCPFSWSRVGTRLMYQWFSQDLSASHGPFRLLFGFWVNCLTLCNGKHFFHGIYRRFMVYLQSPLRIYRMDYDFRPSHESLGKSLDSESAGDPLSEVLITECWEGKFLPIHRYGMIDTSFYSYSSL